MAELDLQSDDKLHPHTDQLLRHQFNGNLINKDLLIVDNSPKETKQHLVKTPTLRNTVATTRKG